MTARARLFIQVYVQTWSVAEAAKRSGTSRAAHYKRMERDPRYKAEFEDCEEIIRDTIREEIRRRAIEGIKRPMMYKGVQCRDENGQLMYLTEYSDYLLLQLARAHCPEFRDKLAVDHKNATVGPLRVVFVDAHTGQEYEKVEDMPARKRVN